MLLADALRQILQCVWAGHACCSADAWHTSTGHKIKEEEFITVSAKAEGEEAATFSLLGLPNVVNKNNSIPHVLCAVLYPLQAPQAAKTDKQENRDRDISDRDTKQLCAMIREQRAKELARIGMANNAARRHRAMVVLKSALSSNLG